MALKGWVGRYIGDVFLLLLVLAMSLFGVVMIYSAGQFDIPDPWLGMVWRDQLTWVGISLVVFLVMVRIPIEWYERLAIPLYSLGLLLLVLTLFIGVGRGTAASVRGWIDLGPVAVQPAQFANLATIMVLARVVGAWREVPRTLWQLWLPLALAGVPLVLIAAQPDLGTGLVLIAVVLAVLFWSGVRLSMIFLLGSPLIALFLSVQEWLFSAYMLLLIGFVFFVYRAKMSEAAVVLLANIVAGTVAMPLWNSLEQYQQNRLIIFLDPTIDPQGAGYQVIQSRVAIGSGGLLGKGFMEGTQKALKFLPEQHTDFIFSVVGEELGFVGAVAVVAVFALILWRLSHIAQRTPDPFAGLLVFGILGAWFMHTFVNVGMTVGVMPVTGIPLPFLSYGGSFLMASYMALALAQRVAAEQARD